MARSHSKDLQELCSGQGVEAISFCLISFHYLIIIVAKDLANDPTRAC